jgi:hypothetical protein
MEGRELREGWLQFAIDITNDEAGKTLLDMPEVSRTVERETNIFGAAIVSRSPLSRVEAVNSSDELMGDATHPPS